LAVQVQLLGSAGSVKETGLHEWRFGPMPQPIAIGFGRRETVFRRWDGVKQIPEVDGHSSALYALVRMASPCNVE